MQNRRRSPEFATALPLLLFLAFAPSGASVELDEGDVLVVDQGAATLLAVDPSNGDRELVSSASVGSGAPLVAPTGVARLPDGRTFLTEPLIFYAAVVEVDPATGDRQVLSGCAAPGCATLVGGGPAFVVPIGIAASPSGGLLVTDASSRSVLLVDPTTGDRSVVSGCVDSACTGAVGAGPLFETPFDVTVDSAGELLVSDSTGDAVFRVDPGSGDRQVVSGCLDAACSGVTGGGPPLSQPLGLAVAASGELVVASELADAALAVDPLTGDRSTRSSAFVGAGEGFVDPLDLAEDADGDLLLTDEGRSTLFRVSPNGDRSALSGCADAPCSATVGGGPGFSAIRGLVLVPEPGAALSWLAGCGFVGALAKRRRSLSRW